jgi:hypothetical protein
LLFWFYSTVRVLSIYCTYVRLVLIIRFLDAVRTPHIFLQQRGQYQNRESLFTCSALPLLLFPSSSHPIVPPNFLVHPPYSSVLLGKFDFSDLGHNTYFNSQRVFFHRRFFFLILIFFKSILDAAHSIAWLLFRLYLYQSKLTVLFG